jgi:hypothetical protein
MRSYSDFLHGKHIAIIGGAKTVDPIAYDADVIIRINEHAITQGGKADVVYSALANNPKVFFEKGIANNLRWFFADRSGRWFSNALEGQFKAHGVKYDSYETKPNAERPPFKEHWLQRILFQYRCKPYTGILAAVHALSLPARSVYLTGCDFYRFEDKTLPFHKDNHITKPNQFILQDLLKYEKRFSVDDVVLETFDYPVRPDAPSDHV